MGASYNNTSNSGPSALNLNNVRSNVNTNIGFLSAYPLGQTGKFKDFSQRKKGKGIYFRSGEAGRIDAAINTVSTELKAGQG